MDRMDRYAVKGSAMVGRVPLATIFPMVIAVFVVLVFGCVPTLMVYTAADSVNSQKRADADKWIAVAGLIVCSLMVTVLTFFYGRMTAGAGLGPVQAMPMSTLLIIFSAMALLVSAFGFGSLLDLVVFNKAKDTVGNTKLGTWKWTGYVVNGIAMGLATLMLILLIYMKSRVRM